MLRSTCIVFAASLALAGCNFANKEEAHYDDSRNPNYKQAQQDLESNNPNGAVADYQAALAADPKLAGAHYELGLIYGDKLADPVGSIYHFKQFLALAPDSDKAGEVKTLIDKQSQAFAASLPNSPAQSSDDYAKMQADNAALRKQLDDATHTINQLQLQLTQMGKHHGHLAMEQPSAPPIVPVDSTGGAATAPAAPDASSTAAQSPTNMATPRAEPVDTNAPDTAATPPASGTNAPASTGPSRSYTVVKGDSIWKIARKMYPGDTKNGEDKIMAANPGVSPKKLKLGQVLVIP